MWTRANRGKTHGRVAHARRRESVTGMTSQQSVPRPPRPPSQRLSKSLRVGGSQLRLQQSSDRLTSIPPGAAKFVDQLALRPRRLASRVPFHQYLERVSVRQRESAHQAAAHSKRLQIAMLASDG